jgi:hypothetical protein
MARRRQPEGNRQGSSVSVFPMPQTAEERIDPNRQEIHYDGPATATALPH